MGTLNLTDPSNGTTADATLIANNNTAIESLVNGNLENDNVKSTAAIAVSKLAAGTDGQFLKTSGTTTTWAAAPGLTVATTVAGLGTASAGAQGMLRLGSSPYDFIALVYDATLAKWVSPLFGTGSIPQLGDGTNGTGGPTEAVDGGQPRALHFPYKVATDAGLVLQARVIGQFTSNNAGNVTWQVGVEHANEGDTAATNIAYTTLYTHAANATHYRKGAWTAVSNLATPKDYLRASLYHTRAASQTALFRGHLDLRWVSA